MSDLLREFTDPAVMDIKMGVRWVFSSVCVCARVCVCVCVCVYGVQE